LFVLYGLFAHIYPVVILHIILVPINLQKLHRIKSEAGDMISSGFGR
jgi:hypothetical protein